MWKFIKYILVGIVVSFYFFPFEFTFLPGLNTKTAMAGIGLVAFILNLAMMRRFEIAPKYVSLSVLAAGVSLASLFSVVVNHTQDYAYARYIISMLVWLSAAYVVVLTIKNVHNYISVKLVCNYLIAVCVAQCVSALLIDYLPIVKSFVNAYVGRFASAGSPIVYDENDRLYGIGAAIDVAGTRFATVLIMIAFITVKFVAKEKKWEVPLYVMSFIVVVVIGNMIARTTTIGAIIAIVIWGVSFCLSKRVSPRLKKWMFVLIISAVPVIMYYYNNNAVFHQQIRFAFEGFFSLAETGSWSTNSNDVLISMFRFPDSAKTWIIGDGYFENPNGDPYYLGYRWRGFYMGTDVGYLRFIYYFGLLGLICFVAYFILAEQICRDKFPQHRLLFLLILILNFIIWFKVSTDLFIVFALFLSIPKKDMSNDIIQDDCDETLNDLP